MRKFIKGWGLTIASKDFQRATLEGRKEQGNGRKREDKNRGLGEHRLHVDAADSILRLAY